MSELRQPPDMTFVNNAFARIDFMAIVAKKRFLWIDLAGVTLENEAQANGLSAGVCKNPVRSENTQDDSKILLRHKLF